MSAIEKYLTANAEFEDSKNHLSRLAAMLQEFSAHLQNYPERTYFANLQGGDLPMDIALSKAAKSFDVDQWPTPNQIQDAILRRYEAKRAAQTAWAEVPPAMRQSLVAPKL